MTKYSSDKAAKIIKQTLKQEEVKIATLNIGLGEGSVVVSHNTSIAGLEARTAIKLGHVKENFQYRTGHSVRMADRIVINIAILTVKNLQVLDRYLTGDGFMLEMSAEKVEAYYIQPKKELDEFGNLVTSGSVLVNSKGHKVKKSDINMDNVYIVKPAYYGQAIKEGKIVAYLLKRGEYTEQDHDLFMNTLTDSGYSKANAEIFKDLDDEKILNKIKADYVRFSTGKAGSVNATGVIQTRYIKEALQLHCISTDFMAEGANYTIFDDAVKLAIQELPQDECDQLIQKCKLLYPEVIYFLGKLYSDGEGLQSSPYASHIMTEFTGHEISEDNVLMHKPQTRELGTSVKEASLITTKEQIMLQLKSIQLRHPESVHHHITYEEMDNDTDLAYEFEQARVGKFIGRFKKYDVITVSFKDVDHKGPVFITLDEIKHVSSYRTMYEETILKFYIPDGEYKTSLSSQVITSAISGSRDEAVKYLSERGAKGIKDLFDGITKKEADKYLTLEADILTQDIYTISALNREIPGLIAHNKRLYESNIKDVMRTSENAINKNQTLDFWGEHFTITPDLSDRIMPGKGVLHNFEIVIKDWKIWKKMIKSDLEAKLKVETDEEQIELLKLELLYLEKDLLFVIRHPKNHDGQFGVYKVVDPNVLLKRSKARIVEAQKTKAFLWDEECHEQFALHLKAMKKGVAMTPATEEFKGLHSGPDFDSDTILAIADRRLVEMSAKNKPVVTYVTFK